MVSKFINKIKELGFKGIVLMNLGLICCAIATVLFITPAKLIIGGATGFAVFLEMVTSIPYYIYLYGVNILLLIISFFTLGKSFTIKTIYGSLMLPTYGFLISKICEWTGFNIAETIGNVEPVFIVLVATFLMGFGIGINMKLGGSTGGFDILEALLLKYFHIPYSTSIYCIDIILIVLGMGFYETTIAKEGIENPVFANWLSEGLAATMYILILGVVVDTITFGGYNKRAVFIRSSKYEEVHDAIINNLFRGLTYINAEGGYSHTPTKMIICICYSKEYFQLREMVQDIDPNAFIFVTKATEVRGLGFNFETPEHIQQRKKRKSKHKKETPKS